MSAHEKNVAAALSAIKTRTLPPLVNGLALGGIAWQRHEGSWGGFLVYVLDLPVSLLYLPMASSQSQQWAASAILGGAWWCVIGVLLGRVAVWAVSAIQHAAKP